MFFFLRDDKSLPDTFGSVNAVICGTMAVIIKPRGNFDIMHPPTGAPLSRTWATFPKKKSKLLNVIIPAQAGNCITTICTWVLFTAFLFVVINSWIKFLLVCRPRWSRGNVLASTSKVRVFKSG